MASIKNLKKDINYTLGDLIDECYLWELENTSDDVNKTDVIIDEAIATFDVLISKLNEKGVENKKAHYTAIAAELETQANVLAGKINNL